MKIPDEVTAFFSAFPHFFIVGHAEPDGDCLGSQLGLKSYIEKTGRTADLFSPGPFIRPEVMEFESLFSNIVPRPSKNTGLIIVDCSTSERIGGFSRLLETMPALVIDHHAAGEPFGHTRWIDPGVPAVTLMVSALFSFSNITPDIRTREALLLGLATDTGFFRHLAGNSSWVFRSAAELIDEEVTPKLVYQKMYGNRPLESRILLGRIFSRLTDHFDGRLLSSYETLEDKNELGVDARDSDLLYSILFGTKNIEALFIIREEDPEKISVGLRSLHDVDVSKIAKHFGGGGHKNAAGFSAVKSREAVYTELLEQFSYYFTQ